MPPASLEGCDILAAPGTCASQPPPPAGGVVELGLASAWHPGLPGRDGASLFTKGSRWFRFSQRGGVLSPYRWDPEAPRASFICPKSHSSLLTNGVTLWHRTTHSPARGTWHITEPPQPCPCPAPPRGSTPGQCCSGGRQHRPPPDPFTPAPLWIRSHLPLRPSNPTSLHSMSSRR